MAAGSVVLVDGLVGSCSDTVVTGAADRLRLVVLVHLPLGVSDPDARPGERRVLSAAAAVVTTSAWTRDVLLATYALRPQAIHVARPGVDEAPVTRVTRAGGRLLCVGAVVAHKGQADLVEALTVVAALPWTCTMVGTHHLDPRYADEVRRRVAAAGLQGRVHLAGALGRDGVDTAYAAADLVVLPSLVETYGMVVTEALARGLPVLATSVGGVREAMGGSPDDLPGVLVPPARPDHLAAALREWLLDDGLRAALRARAVERRGGLEPWSSTVAIVSGVLAGLSRG
jgi:glycosyltransferase involved in cell wall biosynthesis